MFSECSSSLFLYDKWYFGKQFLSLIAKKMALAMKKMPFGLSNYPPAMFISLALPERVESYKTLVQEST